MEWDANPETIAKIRASIAPVRTDIALDKALAKDYPGDCLNLPISGGWGYTQADAIVFVRDRFPDPGLVDYVPLEYRIAKKIIDEELVVTRPADSRFSGIDVQLITQSLSEVDGKKFDCLEFEIASWSERHWEQLKKTFEENDNGTRRGFDTDAYKQRILDAQI
jgi:hypothetical protein